jgi:poly-gamma-glutamate capsule biosynthesis protein CapA/YwtB (metallophosphatase superfamily)
MKVSMLKEVFHKAFRVVSFTAAITLCLALGQVCRAADPITLVFGGDVIFQDEIEHSILMLGNGDYTYPWLNIADFFRKADVSVINVETPVTSKGVLNWMKVGPWFRANPLALDGLKYAGIDVVSVGNNHAFDYSRSGFVDTLANIKTAGMHYISGGLTYNEAYSPLLLEVKGKKIAILGFTNVRYPQWSALPAYTYQGYTYPGCSGVAWLSTSSLRREMALAKALQPDLIIVYVHWGHEYNLTPDAGQINYAHLAIDLGADLVVGHHPHVIQTREVYNGKCIYYSLGNLIFSQSESYQTGVTTGTVLEVVYDGTGISAINEHTIKISELTWQPAFE